MSDFTTQWTVAFLAPLSMGFPRQEYWSALPFCSPEDLPDPMIVPASPALQEDFLLLSHREALKLWVFILMRLFLVNNWCVCVCVFICLCTYLCVCTYGKDDLL